MTSKVSQKIKLGGSASDIDIGAVGHGLMMMTWTPTPKPDEQCFEAIKAGIDALPAGVKMFLNSGDFYAMDHGTGNLEMLARFFAKYPEYADRTFLSVKGGFDWTKTFGPNSSLEFLRAGVDNILRVLGPHKKLDLFEPARVDKTVGIEQLMRNLAVLVAEGKFAHVGLSEVRAETLRVAHAIHPVTAVEIEVNPFALSAGSRDAEIVRGVLAASAELGITVVAYSPIGKGMLTGQIKSPADLPAGDIRQNFTRFSDEIMQHNMAIVNALVAIAEKKGITPAQLSIAWVKQLGENVLPLPGSSQASRTLENLAAGDIRLSYEEVKEIDGVLESNPIRGDRYFGLSDELAHLWA